VTLNRLLWILLLIGCQTSVPAFAQFTPIVQPMMAYTDGTTLFPSKAFIALRMWALRQSN
jgi:hypothetical protein